MGLVHDIVVDCDSIRNGRKGGLYLFWSDYLNISVQSFSLYHIDAVVEEYGQCWHFAGIYRWLEVSRKEQIWRLMRDLSSHVSLPWMCVRDLKAFHEAISECGLQDAGFSGYKNIWTNERKGDVSIQECLDRGLMSWDLSLVYPKLRAQHLARLGSDHAPLMIHGTRPYSRRINKEKLFRFEVMWIRDDGCER